MNETHSVELGSEVFDLVNHLLFSEGRRTQALGDGLICLIQPRLHHDTPLSFLVFYDKNKWTLANAVGSAKGKNCIQVSLRYLSGSSPDDMNYDSLFGFLRAVLSPRSSDVHFYPREQYVKVGAVVASVEPPSGN